MRFQRLMSWSFPVLLLSVVLGCGPQEGSEQSRGKDDTSLVPAPDFALSDVEGNEVKLSTYRGKVVFINFWATWCPPCRAEIPDLVELYKKYKDQGLEILGIALNSPKSEIERMMKKFAINYPVLIGDGDTSSKYGDITAVPTSFWITREGKVYAKLVGRRSKGQLETILRQLL